MYPTDSAPSLWISDRGTNDPPDISTASGSTYIRKSSPQTSTCGSPGAEQTRVAPAPLVCEFIGFSNCDKAFNSGDEAGWIAHIAKDHLIYRASSHSQTDTEACYRKRMHHIAKHLRNGLSGSQMRPDFFLLDHLHKYRLIDDEMFCKAQAYHEAPIPSLQSQASIALTTGPQQIPRRYPAGCSTDILAKDCKPGSNIGPENRPPKLSSIACSSNNSASLNDIWEGKLPSHNTIQSPMVKLETNLSEEAVETFTMRSSPNYSQQYTLPILSKLPEDLESSVSSQTPQSDASSSVTETYIGERKKQIVNSIVSNVTQWLRSMFDSCRKNAGGNSAGGSGTPDESRGSSNKAKSTNLIKPSNQKRKLTQMDNGETDDDNEEGRREGGQSGKRPIQNHENRKYACPYFKYNPTKYKDWRVCPGPGWTDVHRVKEHLYRRHRQPKYRCGRCWQPFKDEQCYMDHLRTEEACPLREMEHVEGFDAAQERSLKSRKRPERELSENDKWRRVFKILFPHVLDDDIPSPFYEYVQTCQKEDSHQHSESDYLAQCEDYMVREVPQRLRQALGRELDRDLTIVEESLRRKAGDWVKTLLEEAFRELRQNRGSDSSSQPLGANEEIAFPMEGPSLQAGSSESSNQRENEAWPSFDFGSFDPFTFLGESEFAFDNGGLLEDLLRPEDGDDSATRKLSDSGYVSHSSMQFEK
ncbi:hypothetical protein F53441_6628 [Fusarium austroafricanum]|uniref:C2H2-type domain-containing protein n=1 Tax=Fusarium austroafricanum TaxID=2364996 RepID=A0A8H4NT41_9HYPO|nr:hypothetical protein F53441_6628 [Fusarium austroafricanum]